MIFKGREKFTAIDLFSGCGGLTLGLKQAGFKVIGAVEINPIIVETYHLNHPEVEVWTDDIRNLNIKEIQKKLKIKKGQLDLLAGCPPCQGFSAVGKKDDADIRNNLVFEFLRFVRDFLPRTIMMENVPGLKDNWRMKEILKELEKLGYNAGDTPTVINAADYGVPQRRKRMILLMGRKKAITLAKEIKKRKTVRETISMLPKPGVSGDKLHDYPARRTTNILNIIKQIPKNGGSRRNMGVKFQLECHTKKDIGFKDIYARMRWDDVAPTMTSGCTNPSKGRFLHPEQNRAITLREAALLQSFPQNYEFSLTGGKSMVSLMIGNALPPRFIKVHAKAVIKYLEI